MLKYIVKLMIVNEDFFDKIEIDDSIVSDDNMPERKSKRKWNLKFFLFLDISHGKCREFRKEILNELPKVKYILETYQVENEFLGYCDYSYNKYENLDDVHGSVLGLIFGVDVNLGYMYVVQMMKHLMRQKNIHRELEIKNISKHYSVMLSPDVFTYNVNAFPDLIKSLYLCGVKYDYERLRYKLYGQDIEDLFKIMYTKKNGPKAKFIYMGEISPDVFSDNSLIDKFNIITAGDVITPPMNFISASDDEKMTDKLQRSSIGINIKEHIRDCSNENKARCFVRLLIHDTWAEAFFYVVFTRTCVFYNINKNSIPNHKIIIMGLDNYGTPVDFDFGVAQRLYTFSLLGFDVNEMISKIYKISRVKNTLSIPYKELVRKIKEKIKDLQESGS